MAVLEGWRRALLVLLLAGTARAGYHFIRLALLAAMGLAGMYMLHMLAQDYNKITNRPRPAVAATRALFRAITKRDVGHVSQDGAAVEVGAEAESPQQGRRGFVGHLLRQVLMQDPLGCARKLVCQLSASTKGLQPHEAAILRLVRHSEEDDDDDEAAVDEFRAAEQLGKASRDAAKCGARYAHCLIEPRTFLKLLQAAGSQ